MKQVLCFLVAMLTLARADEQDTSTDISIPRQPYRIEDNVNYFGYTLLTTQIGVDDCIDMCEELEAECKGFSISKVDQYCYIKTALKGRTYDQDWYSYAQTNQNQIPIREYLYENNVFYNGNDLEYFEGPFEDCASRCDHLYGCVAYALDNTVGQNCFMKNALGNFVYSMNDTIYIASGTPYNRTYLPDYNVFYEGDELLYWYGNFSDCPLQCAATPFCNSYILDTLVGENCWLKQNTNVREPAQNYTAYTAAGKSERVFFEFYNSNFQGFDIGFWDAPYYTCSEACLGTPGCLAYVMDIENGQGCFLKNGIGAISYNAGTDAYVVSNANSTTTRAYTKEENTYFIGSDLLYYTGNQTNCARQCDITNGCIAYTLDIVTPGLNCWLKGSVTTRAYMNQYVSYTINGFTDHNFDYQMNVAYGLSTTNVIVYFQGRFEFCHNECRRTPGCIAYELDVASGQNCWLRSDVSTMSYVSNTVSYVLPLTSQNREYIEERNTIYPGNDILYFEGSFAACPHACTHTPSCVAYTLDYPTGQNCWLKSSLVSRIYKANFTTFGVRWAIFRRAVNEANVQFSGKVILNWSGDLLECPNNCLKTPDCGAYSITTNGCLMYSASNLGNRTYSTGVSTVILNPYNTTRVYIPEMNVAYVGGNIMYWEGPYSECATECNFMQYCVGYSLDLAAGKNCWLKSSLTNRVYKQNVTTFSIPQAVERQFVGELNVIFPGNDLFTWTGDHSQCAYQCAITTGCVAYQIDTTLTSGCNFKSGLSSTKQYVQDQKTYVMTGYRFNQTYMKETNVDYPGNDLLYYIGNFTDCPIACENTPRCIGFSLDSYNGQNCWLKGGFDTRVYKYNAVTFSLFGSTPHSFTQENNTEYRNPDGSGVILTYNGDISTCNSQCVRTPGCQAFELYSNNNSICGLIGGYYDPSGHGLNRQFNLNITTYVLDVSPIGAIRDYSSESNVFYSGQNLIYWPGAQELCRFACSSTPGCIAFSLDNHMVQDNGCWLKSSIGERIYNTNVTTYHVHGYANRTFIPEWNVAYNGLFDCFILQGTTLLTILNVNPFICRSNCIGTPTCTAFQMPTNSTCILQTGINARTYVQGIISFISSGTQNLAGRQYVLEKSISYNGGDLLLWQGPHEDCPLECFKTPLCVGFTYQRNRNNNCWFKKRMVVGQFKENAVSFSIAGSSSRRWVIETGYSYTQGTVLIYTGSVGECQVQCEHTPGCVAFEIASVNATTCAFKNLLGARQESVSSQTFVMTAEY